MRDCRPTVLVVEDEDAVRNLIVTILRLSGFEALHCGDAVAAQDLMAVHGNYIQLMISDVHIGPDLGGIELARDLCGQFPHLRVLYISGLADDSPLDAEVRTGRARFLPKPFSPKSLATMVTSILDDRPRMVPGDPILE
jgi:two-component system, cell cycle sensor histidine kinase and response regulator CckA